MYEQNIVIYLLAHTAPVRSRILQWVKSFPNTENYELPKCSDGALISSLAAKRCYLSFVPGANPNVQKVRSDLASFFDNILKSKHGSVLEHVYYTFAIEGLTRVCTAELNRHRAGSAVSQESMRYCRPHPDKGFPVWKPLSLMENPKDDPDIKAKKAKTWDLMKTAFAKIEEIYNELLELWEVDKLPFSEKKKITSLLRRIVPLGVSTGGVWTWNIRAMRHIIEVRTSPAAEEEIAFLFNKIAHLMVNKEPLLFKDFAKYENGVWRPEYSKV